MKKVAKNLSKNTMITRKLLKKSVESRQGKPRVAEGQVWDRAQESEGRKVRLVHSCSGDGVVVPDEGQDTAETEDIMKEAEVSACRETAPSVLHPGVNVAGRYAREYPGQDEKSLWVKHTIRKMAQQVNIISWVEVGKVEDLLGGTEGAMNVMINMLTLYMECRLEVKNFEVKDSLGVVKSLRGLKVFSSCSAFSFTRRDLGVYHAVYTAGIVEHIVRHAMATQLFLCTVS